MFTFLPPPPPRLVQCPRLSSQLIYFLALLEEKDLLQQVTDLTIVRVWCVLKRSNNFDEACRSEPPILREGVLPFSNLKITLYDYVLPDGFPLALKLLVTDRVALWGVTMSNLYLCFSF